MPDLPAFRDSGTRMEKELTIPELVRHRNKATKSGVFFLVQYSGTRLRRHIKGCQNADAGISFLYANAQLCVKLNITEI
jgi:hypothetical protein